MDSVSNCYTEKARGEKTTLNAYNSIFIRSFEERGDWLMFAR